MKWKRPEENEYAGYFGRYIKQVPEENAFEVLKNAMQSSVVYMKKLTPDDWNHRYADDKWSVKEVWIHILDTERIFAYRLLRIGRGDKTPLAGFEQDDYIIPSKANERTIESIISEYEAVRNNTLALVENLPESAWDEMGTASNNPISARAFAFIIAGHERHHLMGLKENYHL